MTNELAQIPTRTLTRRTVVKGAAWSVPILAAAVATPLAAASTVAPFSTVVTSNFVNNYLDAELRTMVRRYLNTVDAVDGEYNLIQLLAAWRLHRDTWVEFIPWGSTFMNAESSIYHQLTRGFTFGAIDGIIPAGAAFHMSYPAGLLNVGTLSSELTYQLANTGLIVGSITDTETSIMVGPTGLNQQVTVNLAAAWSFAIRSIGALTMTYTGPAPASGSTTASLSAVVQAVTLRQLLDNIAHAPDRWQIGSGLRSELEVLATRVHGTVNVQVAPGNAPVPTT